VSDNPFSIRQGTPEDVGFLFNSFLKSYRDAPDVRGVPSSIYYPAHHAVIEKILQRPCCTCLVACDPQDPSQIFGYCIAEYVQDGLVIHYVYTKYVMRNLSIAKSLVSTLVIPSIKFVQYSHCTRAADLMNKKLVEAGFIYNPYSR
jgi:hypothetical protein